MSLISLSSLRHLSCLGFKVCVSFYYYYFPFYFSLSFSFFRTVGSQVHRPRSDWSEHFFPYFTQPQVHSRCTDCSKRKKCLSLLSSLVQFSCFCSSIGLLFPWFSRVTFLTMIYWFEFNDPWEWGKYSIMLLQWKKKIETTISSKQFLFFFFEK